MQRSSQISLQKRFSVVVVVATVVVVRRGRRVVVRRGLRVVVRGRRVVVVVVGVVFCVVAEFLLIFFHFGIRSFPLLVIMMSAHEKKCSWIDPHPVQHFSFPSTLVSQPQLFPGIAN